MNSAARTATVAPAGTHSDTVVDQVCPTAVAGIASQASGLVPSGSNGAGASSTAAGVPVVVGRTARAWVPVRTRVVVRVAVVPGAGTHVVAVDSNPGLVNVSCDGSG